MCGIYKNSFPSFLILRFIKNDTKPGVFHLKFSLNENNFPDQKNMTKS